MITFIALWAINSVGLECHLDRVEVVGSNPSTNTNNNYMEIVIEWEGIFGVVKVILFVGSIFFLGYLVGKKSK